MSWVQRVLITFGVFWLSLWLARFLDWPAAKLGNKMVYTNTVFNALALGAMMSLGRTLAAIIAGAIVAAVVTGRKPERWAIILAVLYVIDVPGRYVWFHPASSWDRVWQGVALVLPALACIAAGFITARLRRNRSSRSAVA